MKIVSYHKRVKLSLKHNIQAQRLEREFKKLFESHEGGEIPMGELAQKLMNDTRKASDKSKLPHICSLDWEYNLSSIFVQVDTPLVSNFFLNF